MAVVVAAVGLAQALVVAGAAQRRYRTVHRSRVAHPDLRAVRAGALPIAALAGSGVVVGALALAFVVAG